MGISEAVRILSDGARHFIYFTNQIAGPPWGASRPTARLVAPGLLIIPRRHPNPIPVARGSSRGYSDRNRLLDVPVAGVVL